MALLDDFATKLAPALVGAAKSGVQAVRKQKVDRELSVLRASLDSLGTPDKLRTTMVAALESRGLNEAAVAEVTSFMTTDCGAQATHYCAIGALAPSPQRQGDIRLLIEYVRSLLALGAREERAHHGPASEILVRLITVAVQQTSSSLKTHSAQGRALASELVAEAKHQRDLEGLLFTNYAAPRQQSMLKLARQVSSSVDENSSTYIEGYLRKTDTLMLPTLTETVPAPFDVSFVAPRFGLTEESDLAAEGIAQLCQTARSRRHIVILGNPGAGKSTSLQALGRHMATNSDLSSPQLVPFHVTLRQFVRKQETVPTLDFVRYCADHSETREKILDENEIVYLLHVGRAAFLLDGLDEVLDFDQRTQIIESIHALSQAFPTSMIVVSARSAGYSTAPVYRFADVLYAHPFTESQVALFVRNLLDVLPQTGTEERSVDGFMTATRLNPDIRANPLLLGVMTSMYVAGRAVPSNRSDLYAKCAEMIFESWDERKSIAVPFEYVRAAELAIRGMALEVFRAGREEFSERWLKRYLEKFYEQEEGGDHQSAQRFARSALSLWRGRKWILVFVGLDDEGVETYRFSHRSFLEYFAAQEMVYLSAGGRNLFERTLEFLRSRSGVEFMLITVEMLSSRTVNSGEEFIQAGIEAISIESSLSDLEKINIAITLTEAMPSSRVRAHTIQALVSITLELFVQTIPYLRVDWFRTTQRIRSIAFVRTFDPIGNFAFDPDSAKEAEYNDFIIPPWSAEDVEGSGQGVDSDDALGDLVELPSLGETSRLLSALADLRERDRFTAVETIRSAAEVLQETNPEHGLRLAMTLKQLPALDTWAQVDPKFADLILGVGNDLWVAGIAASTPEWLAALDDFWVLLHFVCNEGRGWGAIGELAGPASLFVGGWPLSTLTQSPGVPAHWAVLGLLRAPNPDGLGYLETRRDWPEDDAARFMRWYQQRGGGGWGRRFFDNMVPFHQGFSLVGYDVNDHPSEQEVAVAAELLSTIEASGDADFVHKVRAWAKANGQPEFRRIWASH